MCGIVGYVSPDGGCEPRVIGALTASLVHRGPDGGGVWCDGRRRIALGHRRLAVLDLSPAGHQPMSSRPGRFHLVFNGEIYNYRSLAQELESRGHRFTGHSDTEVMLAAFEEWGVEESVTRFHGMFAFAVWDNRAQTIFLGRDRIGKKPLYYGWQAGVLLFGSELKALMAYPGFQGSVHTDALEEFVQRSYVPSPMSIFRGIYKLPPGTLLSLTLDQCRAPTRHIPDPDAAFVSGHTQPRRYWDINQIASSGELFKGSLDEAVDALEEILTDAVALRMVADVPVGSFLSGGIDSLAITTFMQRASARPVHTFTIGFSDLRYSEAGAAREAAAALGTDHTELVVSEREAQDLIPALPHLFDEPFGDSGQIPALLVSKLARSDVTVALSGDGGDELFGGYPRYRALGALWNVREQIPSSLRVPLARLLDYAPLPELDALGEIIRRISNHSNLKLGSKVQTLRRALRCHHERDFYSIMTRQWEHQVATCVVSPHESSTPASETRSLLDLMMHRDLESYLPDDILVKMDRASMAFGLEVRAPFLDHRVIEFALTLPSSFKLAGSTQKRVLRTLLARHVRPQLLARPKRGFGMPVGEWLRGPLRPWAEDLLSDESLRRHGYFNAPLVRRRWRDHLRGRPGAEHALWNVLMFQAWHSHLRALPRSPLERREPASDTTPSNGRATSHTCTVIPFTPPESAGNNPSRDTVAC